MNYWLRRNRLGRRTFLASLSVSAIGVVGLSAVGCGDNDTGGEASPATAKTQSGGAPATAPAARTTVESVKPVGQLNIADNYGQAVFNPLTYTSGRQTIYRDAIGDGLVNNGRNGGNVALIPALASEYEKTPDGLTWTFKVNPKARFHDGTPVTSADVKFTWETMKLPSSQHARKSELAAALDSVETPDANTAVFKLKVPYAQLDIRSNNWPIISAAAYTKLGADGFEAAPIAAGPFKFVSGRKGDSVNLTAVEGHYRKTPYVKDLVITAVPEEATRIARLQAGEADIIPITAASRKTVEGISGARVVVAKAVGGGWLAFTDPFLGNPTPLKEARVRKAMSLAVNREAITKSILSGEAVLGGSFGLPHFKGAKDLPADKYSLDDAKKLLDAAGYGGGFDTNFYVLSPAAEFIDVMVADWKKIGINAKVVLQDGAAFDARTRAHKDSGIYIQGTGVDYVDPASYGLFLFSDGSYSYLKDPDIDAKAKTLVNGANDEERFKAWGDIQQKVYDETLYANLWYTNSLTGVGKRVKEWTPIPGNGYVLLLDYLKLV